MTKTLNMRTVNAILITVAGVFLTNTVTAKRCWRCRTVNIPFERKKKLVGKGEREVNNNNNNNNNKLLCLLFLKYIFELMINTA